MSYLAADCLVEDVYGILLEVVEKLKLFHTGGTVTTAGTLKN